MHKHIIPPAKERSTGSSEDKVWLPLEHIAAVEVTSEDPEYPVESALLPNQGEGWKAAGSGVQQLRILFNMPQQLRCIRLHFVEASTERTQEFVLRYSTGNGESFQELVRQQWNFSPEGATSEVEEYQVELSGVTTIELVIIPDISGGSACASLAALRLAA